MESGAGDSNWGRYSNAKFDDLLAQSGREPDNTKRNQLLREALLLQRDDLRGDGLGCDDVARAREHLLFQRRHQRTPQRLQ